MAHIDAGKTTTTERILYYTGKSTRLVKCTKVQQPWTGWSKSKSVGLRLRRRLPRVFGMTTVLTLLIPPDTLTFTIEVERSLRVLDGAVTVFDSVAGVEPQSETVWRQADNYDVPRICFVNKMDRIGANFYRCVEMIVSRLGAGPLVIHLPIGLSQSLWGDRFDGHEGHSLEG